MSRPDSLRGQCISEFFGTLILVFFGVGAVNTAVLTGAQSGLWQVAVVWGVAISLAIYATGAVSGTHINPAITVAMAVWRDFPKKKVAPYIGSQILGGFCGSLLLYALFHGVIAHFEAANGIVRGQPGSQLSAMVFGEYFPNPAIFGTGPEAFRQVSHLTAMLAEAVGTAFLVSFVFALTEPRNPEAPRFMVPLFIGLTVSIIISIIAPLTQAALNPARDFGPRLVALLFGWGHIAIPGPRAGFFTVYILAPIIGGIAGAGLYQTFVRRYLPLDLAYDQVEPAAKEVTADA
jgi:glycerol uptake facilitator protein